MTVTEFARKYKIPHSVVYNSAFRIPWEIRMECYMDYPEEEIMKATEGHLKDRIRYHQGLADKTRGYLEALKEGAGHG